MSPLHEATAGAVSATPDGMPLHFGDPAVEYRQTLDSAALFDQSDRGKLEVGGPEAPAFLHNLSTNDIKNLPLGGGCEAYFCDARAKVSTNRDARRTGWGVPWRYWVNSAP